MLKQQALTSNVFEPSNWSKSHSSPDFKLKQIPTSNNLKQALQILKQQPNSSPDFTSNWSKSHSSPDFKTFEGKQASTQALQIWSKSHSFRTSKWSHTHSKSALQIILKQAKIWRKSHFKPDFKRWLQIWSKSHSIFRTSKHWSKSTSNWSKSNFRASNILKQALQCWSKSHFQEARTSKPLKEASKPFRNIFWSTSSKLCNGQRFSTVSNKWSSK